MKQTNKELKKLLLRELDNLSDEQLREYGYERIENNNKRKRFKEGCIRQIKDKTNLVDYLTKELKQREQRVSNVYEWRNT